MRSDNKIFSITIISLGLTSVITQIILLREFLKIFYGNELVVGIVLANWMFITGLGAFTGKYFTKKETGRKTIFIVQFIISFLPIITFIFLKPLRLVFFTYGSVISIINTFLFSFVLMLPYCFLSGFLFIFLCNKLCSYGNQNKVSKAYFLDNAGSIAGGLFFNILLVYLLRPSQSFLLLTIINLVVSLIFSIILKRKTLIILVSFIIIFFLAVITFFDIDNISIKNFYKNQQIIESSDNYLGNITVTKSSGQYNFFENGMLLFSGNDDMTCEESVHYAMSQHKNPMKILLVSGGVSGTINELIKYKPQKIDYIEINPYLLKLGKKYIRQDYHYKGLTIIQKDPFIFLKNSKSKYDVVLINLPEPSNAQINRYYSYEFFKLIKAHSENNTVVSAGLLSAEDYISKSEIDMHSVLYCTMKSFFNNIIIINGLKNYFLASDAPLSYAIGDLIKQKGIENKYVNNNYLDYDMIHERGEYIKNHLNKNAEINTCFKPISYYYQLLYWLNYFKTNYYVVTGLIIIIFIIIVSMMHYIDFALFTGGISAISSEIILIIGFQVIYGYMFQMLGIIITVFMAGLAIGSYVISSAVKPIMKNFINVQLAISSYFLICPVVLLVMKNYVRNEIIINILFYLLALNVSILIGLEYSISSFVKQGNILNKAAQLYSSDLFGSAIGALAISAILIPVAGIVNVCLILCLLNIISALTCNFKSK